MKNRLVFLQSLVGLRASRKISRLGHPLLKGFHPLAGRDNLPGPLFLLLRNEAYIFQNLRDKIRQRPLLAEVRLQAVCQLRQPALLFQPFRKRGVQNAGIQNLCALNQRIAQLLRGINIPLDFLNPVRLLRKPSHRIDHSRHFRTSLRKLVPSLQSSASVRSCSHFSPLEGKISPKPRSSI